MISGRFLLHELSYVWCLCVPSFISYGLSVVVKLMKMFVYMKSLSRNLKVGNMGTAISETKLMDKWAASKRTQVSAILCIKLLPLLENAQF